MQLELVMGLEGDQHGKRHHAARLAIEARPGPDLAPGIAGDQVLKLFIEGIALGQRAVDVRVAEHRPAHRHPRLVALLVLHGHASLPARNPSSDAVKPSAASMLDRCAASSSTYRAPGTRSAPRPPSSAA